MVLETYLIRSVLGHGLFKIDWTKILCGRPGIIIQDTKKTIYLWFGHRNGAESVSDVAEYFELIFTKKWHNKSLEKLWLLNGTIKVSFFSFCSFVRTWTPLTETEIYTVLDPISNDGHCAKIIFYVILVEKKRIISTAGLMISRRRSYL